MFAKDERVADAFRERWGELTEKTYLARVEGEIPEEQGVFESHLLEDADGYRVRSVAQGGRLARTEWRRLSVEDGTTLVEVKLKSGRKNQIRVHFAEAGHAVAGDAKYGGAPSARTRWKGLCLHAWRLAFIHPRTGRRMFFETSLPPFAKKAAPLLDAAPAQSTGGTI